MAAAVGEENKVGNRQGSTAKGGKASALAAKLPERLQKRLQSLPGRPSPEQILAREMQAEEKRETLLKAKVQEQKCQEKKCEEVRGRKKEYEKNIVLLGNCVPSELREIKPIKLPARLQARLDYNRRTKGERMEQLARKEEAASARRAAGAAARVAQARAHGARVETLRAAKASVQRFEAESMSHLPERLQQRLRAVHVPTAEALLRREKLAASRRQLKLEARRQDCRAHAFQVAKVRAARSAFAANQVEFSSSCAVAAALPRRLQARLRSLEPTWTAEALLAKEERARAAQKAQVEAKRQAAKAHLAEVESRLRSKVMRPRFDGAAPSTALPARLAQRLEGLRVRTNEALLRREQLAATRRALRLAATRQQQQVHQAKVAQVIALRRSFAENQMLLRTSLDAGEPRAVLPKRLAERLKALGPKKSLDKLVAKEATATMVRANKLEGVVALAAEHNARVKGVLESKVLKPRFGNNAIAAAALPERLKDRLAAISRLSPEAILRRNEVAAIRAQLHSEARAYKAALFAERARKAAQLKSSMQENGIDLCAAAPAPVRLPARLAARASKLAPKWTSEALLRKEEEAAQRRAELLRKVQQTNRDQGVIVAYMRLRSKVCVRRFADQPQDLTVLPKALQRRLTEVRRRSDKAILERNARNAQRKALLDARKVHDAKLHALHVQEVLELKSALRANDIDMSGRATPMRVPDSILCKLRARRQGPCRVAEAASKREQLVHATQQRVHEHNRVVAARCAEKNTQKRYNSTSYAALPERLRARLDSFRVALPEKILARNLAAQNRRELLVAARRQAATMHLQYVQDVVLTAVAYKDRMHMLTHGEPLPVVTLPARLAKRLDQVNASKPLAAAILNKEKVVQLRRLAEISKRVTHLKAHNELVRSRKLAKRTVPRFQEPNNLLPEHLRERLAQLRSPTKEAILSKLDRASQRRTGLLEATKFASKGHAQYVDKVHQLKKDFVENNVSFGSTDDERIELPENLQRKSEDHRKAVEQARSSDKLNSKLQAVEGQREAILRERVNKNKQHLEKVSRIMKAHSNNNDQVPETD